MGRLHTILMAELEKLNTQSVKDLATGHMINRSQYQQLRKITRACQEIGKFMGRKKTYEMSGNDPRARCDRVLRRLLTTGYTSIAEIHAKTRQPGGIKASRSSVKSGGRSGVRRTSVTRFGQSYWISQQVICGHSQRAILDKGSPLTKDAHGVRECGRRLVNRLLSSSWPS